MAMWIPLARRAAAVLSMFALVALKVGAQPAPDLLSDRVGATSGTFNVDQSGQATYAIPLFVAPGTAGVKPDVALSYSSMGGAGPFGRGWSITGLSSITRCRASREAGDFIQSGAPIDGDPAPVNFSGSDRYCLDGQRLLAVADTPACAAVSGMVASQWRTEIESFQRVCGYTPSAAVANGPAFFTVERKDGSTSWYGDRDSSAAANRPDGYVNSTASAHTEKALTWAQTRFQDSTGNYIDYLYTENPGGSQALGERVISEIRWTGKVVLPGQTGTARAPYARLVFDYVVMFPEQWSRAFVSGGGVTQTQMLVGIRSISDGQQLRYYVPDIASQLESATGSLLLRSITECSNDSRSVCLAPTRFDWGSARNDFAERRQFNGRPFSSKVDFEGMKLADVDGDGRQDMVWLDDGRSGSTCPTEHIYVSYASKDGFTTPAQAPTCTPEEIGGTAEAWQFFDYDGDGRDDLFVQAAAGWAIYPSVGRAFNQQQFDTGRNLLAVPSVLIPRDARPTLADINGDSVLDVVYAGKARIAERQGGAWTWGAERPFTVVGDPCPGRPTGGNIVGYSCATELAQKTSQGFELQLADINGDARSDVIALSTARWLVAPNTSTTLTKTFITALVVDRITATAVEFRVYSSFEAPAIRKAILGDVNADGYADLLSRDGTGAWFVRENTGTEFNFGRYVGADFTVSKLPNDEDVRFIDVTSDGRADVVYPAANYFHYEVRPALPYGGFGAARRVGSGDGLIRCTDNCLGRHARIFADINGDGNLDYLKQQFVNSSGEASPVLEVFQSLQRYTPRDTLMAVTNGFGARTEITYRPMTLAAVHRRPLSTSRNAINWGRGSAVQDMAAPMYVVTEVSSSAPTFNAVGARSRVYYQYFEGRMQGGGRGFLGFRGIFTYDVNRPGGQHVLSRDYYYQAFPFNGMPEQSVKQVVAGVPAIATDTRFAARTPFSAECRSADPEDYCFLAPNSANYPDPGFGGYFGYNFTALESSPAFTPGVATPLFVRPQRTEDFNGGFESGATAKVVTAFQYDGWGNPTNTAVTTSTWPGNVAVGTVTTTAAYTNDGARWRLGRMTSSSVAHARPGKPTITRNTSFGYAMSGAYTGLLTWERTQQGGGAAFDKRTMYTLDAFGNRTASYTCSSDLTDAACRAGITAFRPTSETRVHRYSKVVFDALGRYPVRVVEPFWNASNNAGTERNVQEVLSRNAFGDVLSQRDVNGVQEQRAYGSFGRPYYAWAQTLPGATMGNTAQGVESLVTYRWCAGSAPAGQPAVSCPEGAVFREQTTLESAPTKWVYHDVLGRAMATVTESLQWNVTGRQFAVACAYWDAAGLAERSSQPAFLGAAASNGEPVFPGGRCAAGAWTLSAYDAQGRLTQAITPHVVGMDSLVQHQYSGLVGTTIDPRGFPNTEERNAFGEIVRVTDGVGSTALYAYDAAGALETVTRNAGRGDVVSRFTYDLLGRKASQSDPDTGTWTYAYNAAGELTRTVSARGVTKVDLYDSRGRVFRHTVTPAGASVPEFEDRIDHDQGTGGIGKANRSCRWRPNASNVLAEEQCETSTFDAMGRPLEQTSRIAGTDWSVERLVYDALGRVAERRDATGRWLRTEFAARGHAIRLCEGNGSGLPGCVPDGADTYHQVLEADARGAITLEKRGSTFVQRNFDLIGRLSELRAGNSPGSETAQSERYAYDAAGNLDWRERVGSFKERFAYDGSDRLTRSWHEYSGGAFYGAAAPDENAINSVEVMRFDAFGNICSQRSTGYQWVYGGRAGCGTAGLPGGGNAATEVGTHQAHELRVAGLVIPIQFDANGNQSRALMDGAVVKGLDYDGDDRSTAVWKGGSSAAATRRTRFENGVGGGKVRRIDDGSLYGMPRTTTYLGSVERVERNGAITWRRYVAGVGVQTLAGASPILNHTRFLLQDLLGSAVAVLDAGGSVVERSHFNVYGVRQSGAQFGSGIQTTEKGFTGHEQVDDLETIHMGARVYDPFGGRFLQPDPLVQSVYRPQNWNPYAYAWNNPLRFTDPTGMFNVGRALQMIGTVLQVAAIFIPALHAVMPFINQALSYANVALGFAQGGLRGGLAATFSAVTGGGGGWGGFAKGLVVGGISSVIAGGKFKQGVQGAVLSQAMGRAINAMGGAYRSRQTGGKQANGAETGTQKASLASSYAKTDTPYETNEPKAFTELRERFPELGEKMQAAHEKSISGFLPREHGFIGYESDDGKKMAFVDMPPAEWDWQTMRYSKINFTIEPKLGYTVRVFFHTHPFNPCEASPRCFFTGGSYGPSPQDLRVAEALPSAFSVVRQLDRNLFFGPRARN